MLNSSAAKRGKQHRPTDRSLWKELLPSQDNHPRANKPSKEPTINSFLKLIHAANQHDVNHSISEIISIYDIEDEPNDGQSFRTIRNMILSLIEAGRRVHQQIRDNFHLMLAEMGKYFSQIKKSIEDMRQQYQGQRFRNQCRIKELELQIKEMRIKEQSLHSNQENELISTNRQLRIHISHQNRLLMSLHQQNNFWENQILNMQDKSKQDLDHDRLHHLNKTDPRKARETHALSTFRPLHLNSHTCPFSPQNSTFKPNIAGSPQSVRRFFRKNMYTEWIQSIHQGKSGCSRLNAVGLDQQKQNIQADGKQQCSGAGYRKQPE